MEQSKKNNINVRIADITLSLKATPEEEQTIRTAGRKMNETIKSFLSNFTGLSISDVLAYVLLDTAVKLEMTEKNLKELDNYIQMINRQLNEYLKQ